MNALAEWADRAAALHPLAAAALSLLFNALLAVLCVAGGGVLARRPGTARVTPDPGPADRMETALAVSATVLNAGVTVTGWWLWRQGWLHLDGFTGIWILVDFVVFTLLMDALMYVGHAVAHHRLVYGLVHRLHHRFADPRPLTLFALHPLEVLGFGAMWLLALSVWPVSVWALAAYTVLNAIFGTFGHLGVEPLPARLRGGRAFRWLATPSFHAGHHAQPRYNLGFYTTVWDRLFGTIDPTYDARRRTAVPPPYEKVPYEPVPEAG